MTQFRYDTPLCVDLPRARVQECNTKCVFLSVTLDSYQGSTTQFETSNRDPVR